MELISSHTTACDKRLPACLLPENLQVEWGATSTVTIYEQLTLRARQAVDFIQADDDANRRLEMMQENDSIANGLSTTKKGGVYFSWSDCMNCMKIGATRKDDPMPRLRAASTYTITPFTLVAWMPSSKPFRLEATAHRFFKEKRINHRNERSGAGTEFFRMSELDVTEWFASLPECPVERVSKKRKPSTGNQETTGMSEVGEEAIKKKREMHLARHAAFSIKDLITELELKIIPTHYAAVCKMVCTRFKFLNPGCEMFSKKRRTYFYEKDRECLEKLIQEEYLKYLKRRDEEGLCPASKTTRTLGVPGITWEGLFPISGDVQALSAAEDNGATPPAARVEKVGLVKTPDVRVEEVGLVKKTTAVRVGIGLVKRARLSDLSAYS